MIQVLLTSVGVVAAIALIVSVVFVAGMRRKAGFVQGPIIALGKRRLNKIALQTAGEPGATTSIVRHRGRTSGSMYETPVGVAMEGDAFLIALPYGLRSNWLRNVLASGTATLVHDGATYDVDRPEIVPMTPIEAAFDARAQRMQRMFGVNEALRLQRVASAATTAA